MTTLANVQIPSTKNTTSTRKGLKGKRQKNVGLFMHNMKTKIYRDGCKGIPHNIMGYHPLPTMSAMKKMNPYRAKNWP
jgi:hypothetical protein